LVTADRVRLHRAAADAQRSAMVYEVNLVETAPADAAAFELAFARAAKLLGRVRGCVSVELFRCVERPHAYQVRVGWRRIEDHVEHYPASEEAAEIRALLGPLIAGATPGHFESVRLAPDPA
jgi:heme-degrading monooxygenase HmoA